MTLHLNYIVYAVRYGLVKVSYIIQFDVPPHALDFTQKIILVRISTADCCSSLFM